MRFILDSLAEKHQKVWSGVVLAGSVLTHCASVGFNLGILGSLTIAQSQRFNISINESSWTGSLHMAIFLTFCKYSAVSIDFGYCIIVLVIRLIFWCLKWDRNSF